MVQQRQWRKEHVDSRYAACISRYRREYAIFACLDDKHRIKVGELSCPLAAAERGRLVLLQESPDFRLKSRFHLL